jgi:hypothetical protein
MNLNIEAETDGQSPEKVLEAIYFALRYIKQAGRATCMDKDIFQDADGNSPSTEIVSLTMAIVRRVEQLVGAKAESFDSATFSEVFEFLSKKARGLNGKMTDDERKSAEALAEELAVLPIGYPK